MAPREFLGELEEIVLLAVLRLGDGAYGGSVLRELDEQAGRDAPRGSVYVALDRLEAKGMLKSRTGEPTPGRGGRPRRVVKITQRGREALARTHEVRQRLREGLDEALQP